MSKGNGRNICGIDQSQDSQPTLKIYAGQDVKSYNLAVYMPPLGNPDPDWKGFPVLIHLVDRGDPAAKTADIGAMEMYASAVVSSDPFALAEVMK